MKVDSSLQRANMSTKKMSKSQNIKDHPSKQMANIITAEENLCS